MKYLFTLPLVSLTAFFLTAAPSAWGQQSISQFGLVYSEDFNSFEGTAETVPENFTVTHTAASAWGGVYDSSDGYVNFNRIWAFHDGVDPANIAFGARRSTSGTMLLDWHFVNHTGTSISEFHVNWDFEQFGSDGRATVLTASYSTGDSFTTAGITGTYELTAVETGARSFQIYTPRLSTPGNSFGITLATPLEHGEEITFRWSWENGAGSNSNAHVGVNNLSVTAIPEPSTYAIIVGGLVLAGVLAKRRSRRTS